jgi:hypothetical protein
VLSKEAAKEWNIVFWGNFKSIMNGDKSSNNRKINWLNYPSDIRHVYIRLVCESNTVALQLDFQFKDQGIRDIVWEQMGELKALLEKQMSYPGQWNRSIRNKEGVILDRISWELDDVNFYDQADWPKIHSFFRDRLISFDIFYQEFKDILINLVD